MNNQKKPVPSNKELIAYVIAIGVCMLLMLVVHLGDSTHTAQRLRPDSAAARAGMTVDEYRRMMESPAINIINPNVNDEVREMVMGQNIITETRNHNMTVLFILISVISGLVFTIILRGSKRAQFETLGYSEQWTEEGIKIRTYACGRRELYYGNEKFTTNERK